MKTLVVFYSYSGNTKKIASELAANEAADICEIKDISRPGIIKAYTKGILDTVRGKSRPIQSLNTDLAAYDCLFLLSPVWAGNPPPPVNAALEKLPRGKTVSIKMVSASGKSDCKERLEKVLAAKGCVLADFEDIKA